MNALVLPDLWQQEAVRALRAGHDVIVHAPTGAGKTFIFELFAREMRGRAVYTVPTRALANDKLAEWTQSGWDVGISTGDVARNLDAKVIVATLETQRARLLRGKGPDLLVIDEYQMIADEMRGRNYEIAIAVAPARTQLLLMSGSVANAREISNWLARIGRNPTIIEHTERPVPLTEVLLDELPAGSTGNIRGHWPRLIARALMADYGPILIFAPRRSSAEELARTLAAALPNPNPLVLSAEERELAGKTLGNLLSARIAYHHSGLTYEVRAGIVEPLAKIGKLKAVIATTGLAAGINFSTRSVLVTGTDYAQGAFQKQVSPDELLQMFGRAGRRGLDDTGHVLVFPGLPRLQDAQRKRLKATGMPDWSAFLQRMAHHEEAAWQAALNFKRNLWSGADLAIGMEHSLQHPHMPCGLMVDAERARFTRRTLDEIQCPDGQWIRRPASVDKPLKDITVHENGTWRPALRSPSTLAPFGNGRLMRVPRIDDPKDWIYAKSYPVAAADGTGLFRPNKWLTRLWPVVKKEVPKPISAEDFEVRVFRQISKRIKDGRLADIIPSGGQLVAVVRLDEVKVPAFPCAEEMTVIHPPARSIPQPVCMNCPQQPHCLQAPAGLSPALAWRIFGLVEAHGNVTDRGQIFAQFDYAEGLAIAAALDDANYPVEDIIFDLANLRAGHRFAGLDSPYGGRLAAACQHITHRNDVPGYLSLGLPLSYGAGASEIVRELVTHSTGIKNLLTEELRPGDIQRAFVEWQSLLRAITRCAPLPHPRWNAFATEAERWLRVNVQSLRG